MNAKEEWNLFHTSFLIPSSAVFTGWRYIEVNYAHYVISIDLHTCLFCLFLVVCWLDSLSFLFLSLSSSHSRFSASHSSLFFFCSSSLNNIASIYWIANKRKKKNTSGSLSLFSFLSTGTQTCFIPPFGRTDCSSSLICFPFNIWIFGSLLFVFSFELGLDVSFGFSVESTIAEVVTFSLSVGVTGEFASETQIKQVQRQMYLDSVILHLPSQTSTP